MKIGFVGACLVAAGVLSASSARADIKVGIVISASGPASALGQPQLKTVAALPKEIGGEKIIVRETLDELIAQVVEFRKRVRMTEPCIDRLGTLEGDPPRIGSVPAARRVSDPPGSIRLRGGQ